MVVKIEISKDRFQIEIRSPQPNSALHCYSATVIRYVHQFPTKEKPHKIKCEAFRTFLRFYG